MIQVQTQKVGESETLLLWWPCRDCCTRLTYKQCAATCAEELGTGSLSDIAARWEDNADRSSDVVTCPSDRPRHAARDPSIHLLVAESPVCPPQALTHFCVIMH